MTTPEEIMNGETVVEQSTPTTSDDDVKSKREELSIVACLGSTKEYLGMQMTLGDIHKLSDKDVEKYYKRYKMVSGKNVADGLIDPPLHLLVRLVNWCLSGYGGIDDPDALVKDWKKNQLIKQWLSEASGSIVVHGGVIATLLIIAITALKHFRLREPTPSTTTFYDMANTDELVGVDTVR